VGFWQIWGAVESVSGAGKYGRKRREMLSGGTCENLTKI